MDGLRLALDGIGGDRANQKIALMKKQFDQIENWCRQSVSIGKLGSSGRTSPGVTNVITLDCPAPMKPCLEMTTCLPNRM